MHGEAVMFATPAIAFHTILSLIAIVPAPA